MNGNIIRFRRPVPIRCLRSYNAVADKRSYGCTECQEDILPGMPYHADVMVCGKRLWVERCHSPCCPEDPDKEDREAERLAAEERARLAA